MRRTHPNGSVEIDGLVKVRLVHARHGSILLPDLVMVADAAPFWLQPQWVYPSTLDLDETGRTTLYIGIANKQNVDLIVEVSFDGSDLICSLSDRSQIFLCRVVGPANLAVYKSGRYRQRADGGVDLRLYHHTTKPKKRMILDSQEVWGSAWNFQGTKKLANCSYAYFTNLQRIETPLDLRRIAMAHDGRLPFRLDQSSDGLPPDLVIEVYRESTKNRQSTLGLWVPAEHVAPSHIFQHTNHVVEYEMAHPWIFRVGLKAAGRYYFTRDKAAPEQPDLKRFEHIVLGDCTTLAGLAAPYDEEDTSQTFRIQDIGEGTVFDFWREHRNQALWTQGGETQHFETAPS